MHNKSLTVDGVATIVGGRNVADEYFQAGDQLGYVDLDVLAVGAVVRDVAHSFDEFWSSGSSYPASLLIEPAQPADKARLASLGERARSAPETGPFAAALRDSQVVRAIYTGQLSFVWASVHLVVDDPAKGLGKAARGTELAQRLEERMQHRISKELLIVSPFFIPGDRGRDMLIDIAQRGVTIKVLTNGAESTDVDPACAAYRRYRADLLKAGVELFELKRTRVTGERVESGNAPASLHGKTLGIDHLQIFVGSFNFDPRSANLNTEMGLVIDSPQLTGDLSEGFEQVVPLIAYRLELDGTEHIVWFERTQGSQAPRRITEEPGAGFWRRTWLGFLAIFPIKGEL
jgi:putative cardiolipin synthase